MTSLLLEDSTGLRHRTLANLARGVPDYEPVVTVLEAIDHVLSGRYDAATAYVEANRSKLHGPKKIQWVTPLMALAERHEEHYDQLMSLSTLVMTCWRPT
jgi:hypothetical protein